MHERNLRRLVRGRLARLAAETDDRRVGTDDDESDDGVSTRAAALTPATVTTLESGTYWAVCSLRPQWSSALAWRCCNCGR